jgi:AcrR family transcriptional regulator
MVSQRRDPSPSSRDRLLAAAAAEFAARGYDGAKVDRIATRARLNKAMLYYHFRNKTALYRAILRDVFQALAEAVSAAPGAGGPEDQLRAFIRAIAAETSTRPHFPSMWLREVADGGRHLDATVVAELGRILQTLGAILQAGAREGRFRPANPLRTQMGIVAPLLLFSASAAARERFARAVPSPLITVDRADVVAHIETATLAALRPADASQVSLPRSTRR